MKRSRSIVFLFPLAILLVAGVASAAPPLALAPDSDPRRWVAVLTSDAPKDEKAIACKQLAVCGNAESTEALAGLLADRELSSWARIALEAIPDPVATQAMLNAAERLQGATLKGVIRSLGERRDPEAVEFLIGKMANDSSDVAEAAAVALGTVGGERAADALAAELTDERAEIRLAAAEGAVRCAEGFLDEGRTAYAARLYDAVSSAEVPPLQLAEATRGVILTGGEAATPRLREALRSGDRAMFHAGLAAAREWGGPEVARLLAEEAAVQPATRSPALLAALGDLGDPSTLPVILRAVESGEGLARLEAIGAVRRMQSDAAQPALVASLGDADEAVREAAAAALEELPGEQIDRQLLARLDDANPQSRAGLLRILGRRRNVSIDDLSEYTSDVASIVRHAAYAALASIVEADTIGVLINGVIDPYDPSDAAVAADALRTAVSRLPDRESSVDRLVQSMRGRSSSVQSLLIHAVAATESRRGVEAVHNAARDGGVELQDAATRVLGEWMNAEAASALEDLAQEAEVEKHRVRALRGYLRIARQFARSDAARSEMCRVAVRLAEREEERSLALQVLLQKPSVESLEAAVAIAQEPPTREEATRVAREIAKKLQASDAKVEAVLAELPSP